MWITWSFHDQYIRSVAAGDIAILLTTKKDTTVRRTADLICSKSVRCFGPCAFARFGEWLGVSNTEGLPWRPDLHSDIFLQCKTRLNTPEAFLRGKGRYRERRKKKTCGGKCACKSQQASPQLPPERQCRDAAEMDFSWSGTHYRTPARVLLMFIWYAR